MKKYLINGMVAEGGSFADALLALGTCPVVMDGLGHTEDVRIVRVIGSRECTSGRCYALVSLESGIANVTGERLG